MKVRKVHKKSYVTPALTRHGNIEKITQQFGNSYIDVPQGTSVNNAGPGGTAGSSYIAP
jgi:acetylornithine/succinyldiaminopimelate/putrescine aminotransferase